MGTETQCRGQREGEGERERAEGLHEEIDRLHRQLGEYEDKVKTLTGAKECAHWAKHTALQPGLRFVWLEWYVGSRRLHSFLVNIFSICSEGQASSDKGQISTHCVSNTKQMSGAGVRGMERKDNRGEADGAKAQKVVQRLMNGALVSTFEMWRDQIMEEKQMRAKARKVVQRMLNATLVQVLEVWRDMTAEEKQMKSKALKVVQRMLNATLVQVLEVWRDRTAEEKQMRAKARNVMHRLVNSALARLSATWQKM